MFYVLILATKTTNQTIAVEHTLTNDRAQCIPIKMHTAKEAEKKKWAIEIKRKACLIVIALNVE